MRPDVRTVPCVMGIDPAMTRSSVDFAGPVVADEPDAGAGRHIEGDAIEGLDHGGVGRHRQGPADTPLACERGNSRKGSLFGANALHPR